MVCVCRQALSADPFCYDAYEALMQNHMLTSAQERSAIASLSVHPEDQWLTFLYTAMCKKVSNTLMASGISTIAVSHGTTSALFLLLCVHVCVERPMQMPGELIGSSYALTASCLV